MKTETSLPSTFLLIGGCFLNLSHELAPTTFLGEVQVSSSLYLCGVDPSLRVRVGWHPLPSAVSICSNARGASTLWLRGCYPTVQHGCCEAMSCLPLCLSSDAGVSASALTHLMLKHVLCSNHQGISKLREVSGWSLMHTDPGARCVSGWITLPPPSHETAPEPRTLRSRACIYRCDIQCPS